MTGFAKGLLITGVVLVMIVIVMIAVGVYFISTRGGEYLDKGKQAMEEGQRYGRSTDNQGCLAETLTRYKQSPGFTNAIATELFLGGCLPVSTPTEGFCDDIPQMTEFMRTAKWRVERCTHEGMANDTYCQQIFGQVQQFCERKRTKSSAGRENRIRSPGMTTGFFRSRRCGDFPEPMSSIDIAESNALLSANTFRRIRQTVVAELAPRNTIQTGSPAQQRLQPR